MLIDYIAVLENGDLASAGRFPRRYRSLPPWLGARYRPRLRNVPHRRASRRASDSASWASAAMERRGCRSSKTTTRSGASKSSMEPVSCLLNQPEMTSLKDLRTVLQARNGDFWLGAADSLGADPQRQTAASLARRMASPKRAFSPPSRGAGGRIILAGRESLTEYDGKTFRVLRSIDAAESVSFSPDGMLWAGSGSGIHRHAPGQSGLAGPLDHQYHRRWPAGHRGSQGLCGIPEGRIWWNSLLRRQPVSSRGRSGSPRDQHHRRSESSARRHQAARSGLPSRERTSGSSPPPTA